MSSFAANFKVRKFNSMKYSFTLLALAFALPVFAQTPAQISAQDSSSVYAIKGAKIFTLAGTPIDNGVVVIRDGKIAAVGADVAIPEGAKSSTPRACRCIPACSIPSRKLVWKK